MIDSRFKRIIVIGIVDIAKTVLKYCIDLIINSDIDLEYVKYKDEEFINAENFCRVNNIKYQSVVEKNCLTVFLKKIEEKTLIISVGNYYLFPKDVLEKDNITVINYHYALLPHYKGMNSPSWAIFNNEKETGVTWHYVDESIDGGKIIWQEKLEIKPHEKAWELCKRMCGTAQKGIEEFLPVLLNEEIFGKEQGVSNESIYLSKQIPGNACFNDDDNSVYVYTLLRALDFGYEFLSGSVKVILSGGRLADVKKYKLIDRTYDCKENEKILILNYNSEYKLLIEIKNIRAAKILCLTDENFFIERLKSTYPYAAVEGYSLKSGLKYESDEWEKVKNKISNERYDMMASFVKNFDNCNRIFYESQSIKKYIILDGDDEILSEKYNEKTNERMWDLIADRSDEEGRLSDGNNKKEQAIIQSGWISALTDEPFTKEEMEEYVMNTYRKILPYCNKNKTVLEIGIGSGLICGKLHKEVMEYIGTDISKKSLNITARRLKKENIENVKLLYGNVMDLDKLNLHDIDIVILNSVVQYFPGYNYFIEVMGKLIGTLKKQGIIFIGDVPNYYKREVWKENLNKRGKNINRRDLWYIPDFFGYMPAYYPEIDKVLVSEKHGTIKNELTLYRNDVLFNIDKEKKNIVGKNKTIVYLNQ